METHGNDPPEQTERRLEQRRRTLKGGHLIFNHGHSTFDCRVRNLSSGGALLEISGMLGVPLNFEFAMDDGSMRRACSVRWHTDRLMGVRFEDAAPVGSPGRQI
jgi:hypothetical protein